MHCYLQQGMLHDLLDCVPPIEYHKIVKNDILVLGREKKRTSKRKYGAFSFLFLANNFRLMFLDKNGSLFTIVRYIDMYRIT